MVNLGVGPHSLSLVIFGLLCFTAYEVAAYPQTSHCDKPHQRQEWLAMHVHFRLWRWINVRIVGGH
jgi:hypothetical protein